MGLFDELDIAGAADSPWAIPDNTYPAVVTDLIVKENSAGNMGMTFKYKIREGEHEGTDVSEYKRLPSSVDKEPLSEGEKNKAMAYIKLRLNSLGIPEARMNSIEKEDVIGIECYISTKMTGDFINVRQVTLTSDVDTSGGVTTGNPFA